MLKLKNKLCIISQIVHVCSNCKILIWKLYFKQNFALPNFMAVSWTHSQVYNLHLIPRFWLFALGNPFLSKTSTLHSSFLVPSFLCLFFSLYQALLPKNTPPLVLFTRIWEYNSTTSLTYVAFSFDEKATHL